MRTFAALVFIAGVAAIAIALARTPTVVDGRVMEAEILPAFRGQDVIGVVCDRSIPIGQKGARFGCTATLGGGGTQSLDCELDREGRFTCTPGTGVVLPGQRLPTGNRGQGQGQGQGMTGSGDPWDN